MGGARNKACLSNASTTTVKTTNHDDKFMGAGTDAGGGEGDEAVAVAEVAAGADNSFK